MSEIVFILGAGASRHSGSPLMNDFLGIADELRKTENLGDYKPDFDTVFNAISELQVVHSKSTLDLDNIESVFAAFEMARVINKFPGKSEEEIKSLIISIKHLIIKTLDMTVRYRLKDGKFLPTVYDAFSKLIEDLNLKEKKSSCSIITFNYDIALDQSLESSKYLLEYYISDKPNEIHTPYLKLHGSLNWFQCSGCGEIVGWSISDITKAFGTDVKEDASNYRIMTSETLPPPNYKHCGGNLNPEPLIVPPTWSKTEHHQNISRVWSRAAHELSEAEHVIVSGYSLPESDYFFRYLFALGSVGPNRVKRFWVFNPDGEVEDRFKNLLGLDLMSKIVYVDKTFEDSIGILRDEYNLKN